VRAVIDTNVVAAAFRSKSGASFRLIDEFFALPARWLWSVSSACSFEYEEVLLRQFHDRELVDAFLNDLVAKADKITRVECVRPLLPDPDDEIFAEWPWLRRRIGSLLSTRRTSCRSHRWGWGLLLPRNFLKY